MRRRLGLFLFFPAPGPALRLQACPSFLLRFLTAPRNPPQAPAAATAHRLARPP